ncbi:MAG: hypothetical protein EOM12_15755, partial [Verrucomicrobiae bacterium]|nr:hypothetical protein [Verrucomicrobiae bacterium]
MISTLTILMSYNLLRHALPRRAARIGIVLFACLPFNLWIVIDYYHHIHGTFYFVAALWLLAIILRAPRRTIMVFLASLFLGIVFICMGLQGGIDLMFFGIMCCLSGFNLLKTPAWRRGMRIVLFLFIIPLGMAVPITNYAKATLATFDEYKLDSGLKGFMARGWDIETGGEYSGRLEQIDRETPVDMKKSVLRAFVLSQIYYHPVESLIKLPFLKVAKFYLLGAASGIRESLYASGWPVRAHLFEGMRVGYTFPLLACATLGCCLLWNGRFGRTLEMLLLVVPVLTCFVFTFLGETSPRYSIYVHFSVMGLAGYGLSWFLQKERCVVPDIPYRKIVHWLGITLLLWLLFMGLMGAVVRKYCNHLVFLNLNTASTCDIDDCDKTPDPLRRTFVLGNELCARINNTTYFVSLSTKSQHATNGIFFLWPL